MSSEAFRHSVHRVPTARAVPQGKASSYWAYTKKGVRDPASDVRGMSDAALRLLVEDIEATVAGGGLASTTIGPDGKAVRGPLAAAALAEWASRKGE